LACQVVGSMHTLWPSAQPMFEQNLQHPFHHWVMRVDCIRPRAN
jgi:hypothetical protein